MCFKCNVSLSTFSPSPCVSHPCPRFPLCFTCVFCFVFPLMLIIPPYLHYQTLASTQHHPKKFQCELMLYCEKIKLMKMLFLFTAIILWQNLEHKSSFTVCLWMFFTSVLCQLLREESWVSSAWCDTSSTRRYGWVQNPFFWHAAGSVCCETLLHCYH